MHRRLMMTLMVGLALPAQAVAGPRISTDIAPGVNFSAYKTYAWVDTPLPPVSTRSLSSGSGTVSRRGWFRRAMCQANPAISA